MNTFQLPEAFEQGGEYRLLPFRFLTLDAHRALLVNDVGEHLFVRKSDLTALVEHRLDHRTEVYADLKAKHFIHDSVARAPYELLVAKYRTKRAFLEGFTKLHLFVVTLRCEHSCHYCQVSRVSTDRKSFDMTSETALQSLDLVFQSPAQALKIEFQGGEPLLNFTVIRETVEEAESRARIAGKSIGFVITTNLALIDEEVLDFCREHDIVISTSLDGPAALHNANRPRPGGDSHARTIVGIHRARQALGFDRVAALMTTTRGSLTMGRQIVDEYVLRGFSEIFLRPLSPYGFAARATKTSDYTMAQFLAFYFDTLDYIIDLNRRGVAIAETYTRLLVSRIFTPFSTGYTDLQSPAGAAISTAVYNYDGDVYASDESRMLAEMGDFSFRLGNVHRDSYQAIFGSEKVRTMVASSILESLPGCSDCAFLPYCGSDPVFHYTTQGDLVGHQPTSAFHEKNFAIIRHLIERYDTDAAARGVFRSWIHST